MPQQFFDYDYISTLAGCTIATMLVTQYIKDLPFLRKVHTKLIALLIATIIVMMPDIAVNHFSLYKIPLYMLNSVLAASSAIGGWDTITKGGERSGKKLKSTGSYRSKKEI